MSDFANVAAAAERLGVTDRSVRNWCKSGRLTCEHVGGQWLVAVADLPAPGEPTPPARQPAPAKPALDLTPLTDLVERLAAQNAALAAEVAIQRDRAERAEAALLALPDTTEGAVSVPAPAPVRSVLASVIARLRRS